MKERCGMRFATFTFTFASLGEILRFQHSKNIEHFYQALFFYGPEYHRKYFHGYKYSHSGPQRDIHVRGNNVR